MTEPHRFPDARIALADGRKVRVRKLVIDAQYPGALEGSPRTISEHMLEVLPTVVSRAMPPGTPLYVAPSELPLPQYRVTCELTSDVIDRASCTDEDSLYASRLFVVWFTDELETGVAEQIRALLNDVSWVSVAEDYAWSYI
jgi:hypothetical protein